MERVRPRTGPKKPAPSRRGRADNAVVPSGPTERGKPEHAVGRTVLVRQGHAVARAITRIPRSEAWKMYASPLFPETPPGAGRRRDLPVRRQGERRLRGRIPGLCAARPSWIAPAPAAAWIAASTEGTLCVPSLAAAESESGAR